MSYKVVIAVFLILALAITLPAALQMAKADPYVYLGEGPARADTIPPTVSILSPENFTTYNNVTLAINVTGPTGPDIIGSPIVISIYCTTDWPDWQHWQYAPAYNIPIYKYTTDSSGRITNGEYTNYATSIPLTGVLPGSHNITVTATYHGFYHDTSVGRGELGFTISGSSTVNFTYTPPTGSTADSTPTPPTSPTPSENSQQPPPSQPLTISMPVEYVNYTVSTIKGALWATVDGAYPMRIPTDFMDQPLPMVYPTPLRVTDIHVWLNGQEVAWSNYTQTNPDATHYTYLGNWSMIMCAVQPKSTDFLLTIHYRHPIGQTNGTYEFLYDLNISPYLTEANSSSIAYFSARFETNCSDIQVFRVPGDSSVPRDTTKTPVPFTISQDNGTQLVAFNITSDNLMPNPGDELIAFQDAQTQVSEFPSWILLPLFVISTLLIISRKKRDKK